MCVDSGVHHEPELDNVWGVGGQGSRKCGDGVCHGPSSPCEEAPYVVWLVWWSML